MLRIIIPACELFNDETQEFFTAEAVVLDMEHSLLSLSKWESKYQKPFLTTDRKTKEEIFGYFQSMVVTPGVDLDVLYRLEHSQINEIQAYIESEQTATTFYGDMPERRGPSEVITSELIYYWLVTFTIPFETEAWHLNRLFALVRTCNIKNSKPKKMSPHETAMRNRAENERRRKELGTSG